MNPFPEARRRSNLMPAPVVLDYSGAGVPGLSNPGVVVSSGIPAYADPRQAVVGSSNLDPFSMVKEIRVKGNTSKTLSQLLLILTIGLFAVISLEGGPEFRPGMTGKDKTVIGFIIFVFFVFDLIFYCIRTRISQSIFKMKVVIRVKS